MKQSLQPSFVEFVTLSSAEVRTNQRFNGIKAVVDPLRSAVSTTWASHRANIFVFLSPG
jgi:hypothetical protein